MTNGSRWGDDVAGGLPSPRGPHPEHILEEAAGHYVKIGFHMLASPKQRLCYARWSPLHHTSIVYKEATSQGSGFRTAFALVNVPPHLPTDRWQGISTIRQAYNAPKWALPPVRDAFAEFIRAGLHIIPAEMAMALYRSSRRTRAEGQAARLPASLVRAVRSTDSLIAFGAVAL